MKSNDPSMKSTVMRDGNREKYLVNKEDIKTTQDQKVMPNYLQTSDYHIWTQKTKSEEIAEKQKKKNFLQDYTGLGGM